MVTGRLRSILLLCCILSLAGCNPAGVKREQLKQVSGIYPHLAYYNNEGECGTGAVVVWNGSLWFVTYGPHLPYGSSDKLYRVNADMELTVHEKSIGGTPANRMIHRESNQLFIGPYAIDANDSVRVIPYAAMPGRHTGNARHLFDPANKIYYGTMEEGFYEVDVNTLEVTGLYKDGNVLKQEHEDEGVNPPNDLLFGAHGKGLYSGQGALVYSNNGEATQEALHRFDVESGSLSEWDGRDWKLVRRNQFVEVTGPGGIYGNDNPEKDPVWATGWDHKSVLLGVRDASSGWSFYRLPKASHSYDGAHGWNTEWPRIRDIGTAEKPDYLMTMHGMFWQFPSGFTASASAGIRPRSAYLKVIGDFTRWNDRLVFGCDDSAQKEFLNKRKAKGSLEGPGQSNSNLWFTSLTKPDELGTTTAEGAVWIKEAVEPGEYSEPFLFAGWDERCAWLKNESPTAVSVTFEIDAAGDNNWTQLKTVDIPAKQSVYVPFTAAEKGEWIRLKPDRNTVLTASFSYTDKDTRSATPGNIFAGLTSIERESSTGGLLYGLGDGRRALGILANTIDESGIRESGYYEMNDRLELVKKDDAKTAGFIRNTCAIPGDAVSIEESSVLVIDDLGRRWRLPLGNRAYTGFTNAGTLRICREVATERDLFNCHGTFYELPAENADGYAKIRPVSSHNLMINDYASYRGMLLMTGLTPADASGGNNEHVIVSDDGKAAVWAGVIDDLWKLGKPVGTGGPWLNTDTKAKQPSDPYLIAFYDDRTLSLSHKSEESVIFTVEADPTGNGDWMTYSTKTVKQGETLKEKFPAGFQARWIRFYTNIDTKATAWLEYD